MQEDTASETPQCRQSELRQAARTLPSICTWAQISDIQFLYLAGEKRHQTPGFLPVLCLPVYWFFPTQVLSRQGQHHRSCSILTHSSPCCHQDKGGDIAPEGWGKCFFSHPHGIDGPAWAEQEQSWGERPWGGAKVYAMRMRWFCVGRTDNRASKHSMLPNMIFNQHKPFCNTSREWLTEKLQAGVSKNSLCYSVNIH